MSSNENTQNSGLVPYRVIAYGLFVAVIGLCIHIYKTNITAQAAVDSSQSTVASGQEVRLRTMESAVILLTQIVCQQKSANCTSINLSSNK